jgi:hypothetical protein
MLQPAVERILRARVYELAIETPLQEARRLSERVLVKREDLQPILSFKIRDACNNIVSLAREQAGRGLVAASAGNHAQGVALAAARFGYRATILMPRSTPRRVQSGANINFHGLHQILERVELGEERQVIFAVTLPERPGACRGLCSALGDHDITEFSFRYAGLDAAPRIFLGVEVAGGAAERAEITLKLKQQGYEVVDMTGNEMAMVHARHLVGGRAPDLPHERLLRFEFPQRPGALHRFIDLISPSWNLTLCHYRKGAARGWVLTGIQVPPRDEPSFLHALDELGYPWVEETDNEAYRLFLR